MQAVGFLKCLPGFSPGAWHDVLLYVKLINQFFARVPGAD